MEPELLHSRVDQFNRVNETYKGFVDVDPMRNGWHYPSVLEKLGDISGQRILDVGCGSGQFDRLLAERGARVVAYDGGQDLIAQAKKIELNNPVGIDFQVATAADFYDPEPFDNATSVLVIPYATDEAYLANFFNSTAAALKPSGRFVSVTINPDFNAFDEIVGNRRFVREGDRGLKVNFLDPTTSELKLQSHLTQFDRKAYETVARAAGFETIEWDPLMPTQESLDKYGQEFWAKPIATQPYIVLTVGKPK